MSGFRISPNGSNEILVWKGDPDDNAAHQKILGWLHAMNPVDFLGPTESMNNKTRGNLGEFITYKIGKNYVFANNTYPDPVNAYTPLSRHSSAGVDIIWLYFGDVETDDWAAIQEVKTTGLSSLNLAFDLVSDYDKLFGERLSFRLDARLGALKSRLEDWGKGEFVRRLTALGGQCPSSVHGIRLFPTLVHDSVSESFVNMKQVRQRLINQGWPPEIIQCWSISLSDLNDRLNRLARGQP